MNSSQSHPDTSQQKRDPDLIHTEIAMKRVAIKARKLAQQNSTAVVILENGIIREEYPDPVDSDQSVNKTQIMV